MIDFITALFLGFVEGLTEFLPVSSTAHLLLLTDFLDFNGPQGHSFEIFIQLGAILAVVTHYRGRLWKTATSWHRDAAARHFILILVIGTIPALIAGALCRDFIKENLYTPEIIATALIIGGVIMLIFENRAKKIESSDSVDQVSLKTALIVGLFQTLALIPGVSRSAASIIGGRSQGLSRMTAAEFSFFLAIPVMFAAVSYDTFKNWDDIFSGGHMPVMLMGFAGAYLTALAVLKLALHIINKYGFTPFAYYRILAGILILGFVT